MKFKLGDTDIPFVFRGDELMYPNYVKDGLVLHYDFSGMTNADTSRGIATDLSGNGNHGTLQNFNYTAESGYDKNKLLFDEVDDGVIVSNPLSNQTAENQSWSVEFVVKKQRVISTHTRLLTGINLGLSYAWSDTALTYRMLNYIGLSADIYLYSPYSVQDEVTHHIVFSYSSVDRMVSIAVDNKSTAKTHSSDLVPSGMERNIGIDLKGGQVSSFKIYNRPLTPEEIAHNYAIEKERFGIE